MKVILLSVFCLAAMSFSSTNLTTSNSTAVAAGCTNCWNYADNLEMSNYGPHGNFEFWQRVFNHCNEHLNPCAEQMDPVVISPVDDSKVHD